ncbi:MAG: recombination protein RecR [Acidimicrobiaceae bacterium]|nr:recombination protein RecR [Acidimicrobiaceae bacterium]MCH9805398.1 recombination mediator RecR [bacterium]MDB4103460.1 recombination mediator RecR [Acidimicrobiales bacterium]MCO4833455.1 recombination protein RecR [Acidimicrobiaceae bacterium]MDB9845843.1 recombination mediator RecR [Acidimicrobiales bacterium]
MYSAPIQDLIDEFGRLPGIGPKSAQRITFHLLRVPATEAHRLAKAIVEAKERVKFCHTCYNLSELERCEICSDDQRDGTVVCVVEDARDVIAVERTNEFSGKYHVLQGTINPIEGIGPEQLRITELMRRITDEGVTEVIVCTNPNIEGEATAMYLARLLGPTPGLTITRLASGLPVGSDLEYADEITLGRALTGRRLITDS